MTTAKLPWTTGAPSASSRTIPLGRLEDSLGYNVRLAQLKMFGVFAAASAEHAITPSQFAVLLLIEANPGIKQIELADVLDVDRSTMVRLVDRCEQAKLVKRGSSKTDRRIAPPMLTARGRSLVERLEPIVSREEALASGLSRSERATFLRLLKRVAAVPQGDRS